MDRRRLPRGTPDRRSNTKHRQQCARWLKLADVALRLERRNDTIQQLISRSRNLAKRGAALIQRANQLARRNYENKLHPRQKYSWSLQKELHLSVEYRGRITGIPLHGDSEVQAEPYLPVAGKHIGGEHSQGAKDYRDGANARAFAKTNHRLEDGPSNALKNRSANAHK